MKLSAPIRIVRPWAMVAMLITLMTSFVAIPGAFKSDYPLPIALALASVTIGSIVGLALAARRKDASSSQIELSRETGITLNGKVVMPRDRIEQAYFVPKTVTPTTRHRKGGPRVRGPHVVVLGKGVSTEIDVKDAAEGEAVLTSLGADVSHQRASFRAVSALTTVSGKLFMLTLCLGIGLGLLGFALGVSLPLIALGFVLAGVAGPVFLPSQIDVGSDGVLVKGRAHSSIYRYEDIAQCGEYARGIQLRLKNGRDVQIALIGNNRAPTDTDRQHKAAMRTRINEGMKLKGEFAAAAQPQRHLIRQLERGGRPFKEWIHTLLTLEATDEGDFRRAPLPNADLFAVLDDSTSAEKRLAAALVLAKRDLATDEKNRIRIAAEASAAPKLRVALEAIAAGNLEPESLEDVVRAADAEARKP